MAGATPKPFTIREFLSYSAQLYLPRLPFLKDLFPGDAPYDLVQGPAGALRLARLRLPRLRCYPVVALLSAAVVVLALRALIVDARCCARAWSSCSSTCLRRGAGGRRRARRLPEPRAGRRPFEQARYLLPLLGLLAGVVALGVRGAAPLGPAPGAAAVMVVLVLDVGAQLLTLGRYYG